MQCYFVVGHDAIHSRFDQTIRQIGAKHQSIVCLCMYNGKRTKITTTIVNNAANRVKRHPLQNDNVMRYIYGHMIFGGEYNVFMKSSQYSSIET